MIYMVRLEVPSNPNEILNCYINSFVNVHITNFIDDFKFKKLICGGRESNTMIGLEFFQNLIQHLAPRQ